MPGQPLTELDKQVMYWENKGKLVPTRELIKTPEQIEGIRKVVLSILVAWMRWLRLSVRV